MELFSVLGKLVLDSSEFDRAIDEAQRKADGFEMPDDQELEVTVDTDEFDQAAGAIEQRGGEMEGHLTDAFTGIKSALVATGIVTAFTTIAGTMAQMVNLTTQTADAIDKGSSRLQISTGAYQRWNHALSLSGASISDLGRGMRNFQNITAAVASGELQDLRGAMEGVADAEEEIQIGGMGIKKDAVLALEELGIKISDYQNAEELMQAAMFALADMGDEESDNRGRLARALFGNGADSLFPLLDQGREGIENLLNEADDLGLVMSDQEIQNGVELADSMSRLNEEWQAIQTALMSDFIPVLREAVDAITGLLKTLNPRNQETSLSQTFASIQSGALESARTINTAEAEALELVNRLEEMGNYWDLDEQGQATWNATAKRAIELFPDLSGKIDTNNKKINGSTEELRANIRAWADLRREQVMATAMQQQYDALAQAHADAINMRVDADLSEAHAEAVRVDTIRRLNEELRASGLDELSESATQEEIFAAANDWRLSTSIAERMYGDDSASANAYIQGIVGEYETAINDAAQLRQQAADLEEQAAQAEASFQYRAQLLEEQIYGTKNSTEEAREEVRRFHKELDNLPDSVTTSVNFLPNFVQAHTHAIGSSFIPFDNYPALLHRGEKIITATEARQMGNGEVDYGRLEDALRGAITSGMQDATVVAVVTDRDVGRGANRYNGNELDAGRFRP